MKPFAGRASSRARRRSARGFCPIRARRSLKPKGRPDSGLGSASVHDRRRNFKAGSRKTGFGILLKQKRETAFNFGVQGKRSELMSSDINRYLPYLVIVVVLGYAATKILY